MDRINDGCQRRLESRSIIVVPSKNKHDNHDGNLIETLQSPSPSVRHARRGVTENVRDRFPAFHCDLDTICDGMNEGNKKNPCVMILQHVLPSE